MDITNGRELANRLVEISQTLPSNKEPQRAGGYFLFSDSGLTQAMFKIGSIADPTKERKYSFLVQEKAHRLYAEWCRAQVFPDEEVFSSWQTRDESRHRYGGAVLFPIRSEYPMILSFSGQREEVNEAIVLTMGRLMDIADDTYTKRVAAFSNNQVFPEMLQAYRKASK